MGGITPRTSRQPRPRRRRTFRWTWPPRSRRRISPTVPTATCPRCSSPRRNVPGPHARLLWTADTFLTTVPARSREEGIAWLLGFRWGSRGDGHPRPGAGAAAVGGDGCRDLERLTCPRCGTSMARGGSGRHRRGDPPPSARLGSAAIRVTLCIRCHLTPGLRTRVGPGMMSGAGKESR